MELYQLKSFVEIAKTSNLTKAAAYLNISQSALSTQIKALEGYLGVSLFERTSKGMVLTQAGQKLLVNAKKILQAAFSMEQKACDLADSVFGILKIGINTDPKFLDISGISKMAASHMPSVNIKFVESQTFETRFMLIKKEIDAGFHFGKMDDLSICSTELAQVPVCVVIPRAIVPEGQNLSLEEIARLPWVWTTHSCPFHIEFTRILDTHGIKLNQVTDAVEENIVRELVISGTGLALARKDEALRLERQGYVNVWKGFELVIPLHIATLLKRMNEKPVKAFLDLILKKYKIC